MGAKIIDLAKYRRDKELEKIREEAGQSNVKDDIRASLDNDLVKAKYKIKEPTAQEMQERIQERIKRINQLMKDLEESTKK